LISRRIDFLEALQRNKKTMGPEPDVKAATGVSVRGVEPC
jgi:hypothetical protein